MIALTRRYHFSASHRLHSPELSDTQNERLYGKCNHPFGHGHDYVLEVTASGPVDPLTGLVLPTSTVDRLVQETVIKQFAFRNINLDIPEFAVVVPTTENIAQHIVDLLQHHWAEYIPDPHVTLARVHVQETDRNGFDVLIGTPRDQSSVRESERVLTHA